MKLRFILNKQNITMKYTEQIKFSTIKQLETIDNKVKSILNRNVYFIPYLFFIIWLFFTACLWSLKHFN
jgi:hypothetical protein